MVLTIWMCRNFLRSTYGRKIIAIGQDPVAAEMIGIRLLPNQMLSLGSARRLPACRGVARALCHFHPAGDLQHGSVESADCRCGVRRMGSLTGPFVATALFVVVPELFRGLALWRLVLYGVLLVVIMNLRPKGLYGHEELNLSNLPSCSSSSVSPWA